MKKSKNVFLPVFLLLLGVLFSCLQIAVFAEEAELLPNSVTLSATQEVTQGETYYGYVYLDNPEEVASLNLSVHYDPAFVTVTSTYNQIPCALYDSSLKDNTLTYSYIFGGDTPAGKANLFYFTYSVCTDAPIESSYFDIVIDEAYASDLTVADVRGSRYAFHVNERKIAKTAYVYGTSGISSQKEQEFEINYYFSTTEIASGAVSIQYDKDLFEFVSLTQSGFLNGKIADVNSSLAGTVYVSFLGTEYASSTDFLRVKFKTIGNVTENSQIKLVVSDLYDLELTPISCSGYTTSINLTYDSTYDDSLPRIFLTSSYDTEKNQVQMFVKLSANTRLGAGDFVLNWDTTYLQFASYEKKFSPTFFNVNDKNTDSGVLKFSIISFSDIIETTDVLYLSFDVLNPHDETSTSIDIVGSGISDSLTNPICLNYVGCNQTIPGKFVYGDLNDDGLVNKKDSLLMKMYLADNTTVINQDAADVFADGAINKKDSLLLKQFLAGLDVVLGT